MLQVDQPALAQLGTDAPRRCVFRLARLPDARAGASDHGPARVGRLKGCCSHVPSAPRHVDCPHLGRLRSRPALPAARRARAGRASGRARRRPPGLARRPRLADAVRRSGAHRAGHDGAAAELRPAHRGGARAAGAGHRPHPPQRPLPDARRVGRRHHQRRLAQGRHADPGRRRPRRHLRRGRRAARLGAGRLGPPPQPRDGGGVALPGERGGASRGGHDPDRRRDGALPRVARARSRARHREAHQRGRHRRPAADAGAAGARHRQQPGRAPGGAAPLHRARAGRRGGARHRAAGARAQPAARPRAERHRPRPGARSAGGAAGRAGRPAVVAARAAARHPAGRAGADCRQRRDRRGARRVLPAHQPDRAPRHPEPIALRAGQRRRRPVVGRPRRSGADLQRRPHRRQRPLRRIGAARAGRALPAGDPRRRCATSPTRWSATARPPISAASSSSSSTRSPPPRACRGSATRAASTTTCRCSTRSETCFRASSIWRGCASRSSRPSSSCIAPSAAAGHPIRRRSCSRRPRRSAELGARGLPC